MQHAVSPPRRQRGFMVSPSEPFARPILGFLTAGRPFYPPTACGATTDEQKHAIQYLVLVGRLHCFDCIPIFFTTATQVAQIPYSQFETDLKNGKIAEVAVSDNFIQGRYKQAQNERPFFVTTRVEPGLADRLQQHGVVVTGQIESTFLRDLLSCCGLAQYPVEVEVFFEIAKLSACWSNDGASRKTATVARFARTNRSVQQETARSDRQPPAWSDRVCGSTPFKARDRRHPGSAACCRLAVVSVGWRVRVTALELNAREESGADTWPT